MDRITRLASNWPSSSMSIRPKIGAIKPSRQPRCHANRTQGSWSSGDVRTVKKATCLCDSSRCFIRTATTTLTSTNWAISTKMTKKMGAMMCDTQQFFRQSADESQFSRSVSFMIPFQLSPVATRNRVRKAIPKLAKCACSLKPWHGWSSSHSVTHKWNKGHTVEALQYSFKKKR